MTSTAFVDVASGLAGRKHAKRWQLFMVLVSLATLLPFAAAPLASHVISKDSPALYVYFALGFVGANFHVAATGWFYSDPEMRAHFRSRPARYIVVPCLLVAVSAAAFSLLDYVHSIYLVIAFLCWQLWHYQKQNLGLLSFIAAGSDGVPLSIWERRTLSLSAIAGMFGFLSLAEIDSTDLSAHFGQLHRVGALLYLLVPIAFCLALAENPALRRNKLRVIFLSVGALAFLPIFVFSDPPSALVGYGMAHGLQYFVFMVFVSAGKRNAIASLATLLVVATCGGFILNRMSGAPYALGSTLGLALYGAFLGIVMTHFVLDAGIWRLREPFQRSYMRTKFYFVFDR